MASIRRHCLERDKGIVCTARNCRASHRRQGLAPRCRLVASWGWSRSQGLGCSPIKAVRELGLERKLHCVLLQKCGTRNPTYIGGTRPESPNAPRATPREDGLARRRQSPHSVLFWLKGQLGYGHIRDRNDAMCECTIVELRSRAQGSRGGMNSPASIFV